MGFVSEGRATATNYLLRAAATIEPCETTLNFWVRGTCGHILDCVAPRDVARWQERITLGRRHRRRCHYCPKP